MWVFWSYHGKSFILNEQIGGILLHCLPLGFSTTVAMYYIFSSTNTWWRKRPVSPKKTTFVTLFVVTAVKTYLLDISTLKKNQLIREVSVPAKTEKGNWWILEGHLLPRWPISFRQKNSSIFLYRCSINSAWNIWGGNWKQSSLAL